MTSGALLGIDVGTTSVKAVMMSADGQMLAEAASDSIRTSSPQPGAAEQNADEIWQALVQAIRRVTAKAPGQQVRGLCMAAQSGSVVPIDARNLPAGPVMLWMDTRSRSTVESWSSEVMAEIRQISGWTAGSGTGLSTLAWLQQDRAAEFSRGTRFASVDDYAMHMLTGAWTTNPSNASGMQFMDVARTTWSETLCSLAGIDKRQLSLIVPAAEVVGALTSEAAEATGLAQDTLVVSGGHDQACAAYGLGVGEPKSVLLSAGTAWVPTAPTDHADVSRLPDGLNLSPHVRPARWTASQSLGALGAMISWWRSDVCADPGCLERCLGGQTPDPSAPLFLPALASEHRVGWGTFSDGHATGDTPTQCHAVVEAAAFEVRKALLWLDPVVGEVERLTLIGGAAKSAAVPQLIADVVGLPIDVHAGTSWPACGAASLAAVGFEWPSPASTGDQSVRFEPDRTYSDVYSTRFETYRQLMAEGARPGDGRKQGVHSE